MIRIRFGIDKMYLKIFPIIFLLITQIVDKYFPIALYGLFVFAFIVGLFISKEYNLLWMLSLLPANRLLTIGGISVLSILMITCITQEFFNGKTKIPQGIMVGILGLLILACFNNDFLGIAKMIVLLLYLYLVFQDLDVDIFSLLDYFCLGVLFSGLFGLIFDRTSLTDFGRFTLAKQGGQNIYGLFAAIAISFYLFNIQNRNLGVRAYFGIGFLMIMGLLTNSRTFILGVAVIAIIFAIENLGPKNILKLFFAILVVIGAYYFLNKVSFINSSVLSIIDRFLHPKNGDLSNGRTDLWMNYIDIFRNNCKILLIGSKDYSQYNVSLVAHNMLIEQIADYGIIGFVIISLSYISIYKHLQFNVGSINKYSKASIISLVVMGLVSHSFYSIPQAILLTLSLMIAFRRKRKI